MTGVKDIAEGKIGKVLGAEKSKLKGGISIDLEMVIRRAEKKAKEYVF